MNNSLKNILFLNCIKFNITLLLLFFLFYQKFKNQIRIKAAICLVAKQENRYINEFVEYYRKLKIKKIFLYDNNDINGERFEEILSKYIKNKFIDLINYRGLYKPQMQSYNNCYLNNNKDFDWIAFYDADEYLYINNYTNINEFLSLPKFKNCSNILINWKYYGDNDNIYYQPKPVQERFTKPFYFKKNINKNIYFYVAAKTIVRGRLNLTWGHFPHYLKNKPICRPDGTIVKNYFSSPQYYIAFIKHYATKSTEEYIERLIRGAVLTKDNSKEYIKYRIKNYYFLFNEINNKKKNFFEKKLNISLNF